MMNLAKLSLFAAFSLGLALPCAARAQAPGLDPPVLIWGFQHGCDVMEDSARYVQRSFEEAGIKPAYYLAPESVRMGCQGAACAAQVQQQCPAAKGYVVGGIVQPNEDRSIVQARVWVHNLSSGQTLWKDTYCSGCSLSNMLFVAAGEMIQKGAADTTQPPSATPFYCQPAETAPAQAAMSPKVYWVVYGKEHHRAVIGSTIRKTLTDSASIEVPMEHIGRDYTPMLLKKALVKDPTAQIVGAEVQSGGIVQMFIYDGRTEKLEQQTIECPNCDKEELAAQIRRATVLMLSQCFGDKCAESGVTRGRAPKLACTPFQELRCGDPQYRSVVMNGGGSALTGSAPVTTVLTPSFARTVMGISWGAVALSGAATVGLLAANYAGAGSNVVGTRLRVDDELLPAVGTAAGATLLSLGVAIPLTFMVHRAARPPAPANPASPAPGRAATGIQCP